MYAWASKCRRKTLLTDGVAHSDKKNPREPHTFNSFLIPDSPTHQKSSNTRG